MNAVNQRKAAKLSRGPPQTTAFSKASHPNRHLLFLSWKHGGLKKTVWREAESWVIDILCLFDCNQTHKNLNLYCISEEVRRVFKLEWLNVALRMLDVVTANFSLFFCFLNEHVRNTESLFTQLFPYSREETTLLLKDSFQWHQTSPLHSSVSIFVLFISVCVLNPTDGAVVLRW